MESDSKRAVLNAIPTGFQPEDPSNDIFETIVARNSMGEALNCYHITTAEVDRRSNGVERLNSSSLATTLRRTKQKNGGETMRRQMKEKEIPVNLYHRQEVFPNKIIALSEAEAVHMAKDLEKIVKDDYPVKEIAREVANEVMEDGSVDIEQFFNADGFKECMEALGGVLSAVVPPITGICAKASKNEELNLGMENFSQATHGFGIVVQPIWMRALTEIGEGISKIVKDEIGVTEEVVSTETPKIAEQAPKIAEEKATNIADGAEAESEETVVVVD
ncbi:hypothetical protein GCK72_011686 [Caenorhabditis remanei]|uniref:Transcription factor AP-2 C-terminal domain-containing protein n=1 Tax=Caenorhabditis remanei TaxID=31234 RepID=A0A6A5H6G3_CAERE|nr:hypothetical protein GCK72_011686 [Caenorhabditis remanei]KAF1763420.1 hypothetical protein GCK72_011686 [Caenorhabditis remanei]